MSVKVFSAALVLVLLFSVFPIAFVNSQGVPNPDHIYYATTDLPDTVDPHYYYTMWKEAVGTPIDVDVAAFDVDLGSNNITAHLISQSYHSPRAGVPWMKLNFTSGATVPIVNCYAHVKSYDASSPTVVVLVTWVGITASGHIEEFGYDYDIISGGEQLALGPQAISNVMPAVGDYYLWINTYVMSDNVININVTRNFNAQWFKALVYCDQNGDDVVDMQDYQMVKNAVVSTPGSLKWRWTADVNCDGVVDMQDFAIVKALIVPVHDVNVTSVTTSKTVVGKGSNMNISVTVENQGPSTETFNVTTCANATMINQTQITLASLSSTNFTFTWNTSGFAYAYTISANATILPGETDTSDNTFVDGLIKVSCLGDLNGDYITDGQDYQLVKKAVPSSPGSPKWNPNADLNDDGIVDGQDFQTVKNNIGQSAP